MKLYFVRTNDNLADFLTREGLPPGDCEKFNLKNISIANFHHELPKLEFTLPEWIDFVDSHPEYLMINAPNPQKVKALALQITAGLDNVQAVVTPLEMRWKKKKQKKFRGTACLTINSPSSPQFASVETDTTTMATTTVTTTVTTKVTTVLHNFANVLATFQKNGRFFQTSGHPVSQYNIDKHTQNSKVEAHEYVKPKVLVLEPLVSDKLTLKVLSSGN